MKLRDIPKSGRDGSVVHCRRGGAQYERRHVQPKDPKTDPQHRAREIMTAVSKGFGNWLTEAEREAWNAAAEKLQSRPRLGQSGPLTGEVLFSKLNCPRTLIERAWLRLPTAPVVFGPSPVGELTLRWERGRLRVELAVAGLVTDDVMVWATPPCRATWRKCRKARYLCLLPTPMDGVSDVTAVYVERFGEPEPGQRIFIRIVQQRNGWESEPVDTSNLVPAKALCAPVSTPNSGSQEAELRTLDLEARTLNQGRVEAWGLEFGACLELGAWNLELSRPPCLREIVAVHTVSARWTSPGWRRLRGRIGHPRRAKEGCHRGQAARDAPWHGRCHFSGADSRRSIGLRCA